MQVSLYYTYDDNKKVSKTLNSLGDYTVTNKMGINRESPVITFTTDTNISNILQKCNYCYIPEFARYYYCTVAMLNGFQYQISCTGCDVLMSFRSQILNSSGLCTRNEYIGINDITDTLLPLNDYKSIKVASLGESLNKNGSYPFVLNVAGGGGD